MKAPIPQILIPAVLAAAMLAWTPSESEANPIGGLGGTLGPQNFAISANFSYLVREMEADSGGEFTFATKRFTARVNYGLMHHFNAYLQLGLADALFEDEDFRAPLDTWVGVGIRGALLPRESRIQLLIDGQIGFYTPEDSGKKADITELQLSFYAKIPAESSTFFAGFELSEVLMDIRPGVDATANDKFGAFIGLDYFANAHVFFNAELHIFDQQSLFLGVGYRL